MGSTRRLTAGVVATLLLLAAVSCGGDEGDPSGSGPPATDAPATPASWTWFGFDDDMSRYNPVETTLGPDNVDRLELAWSIDDLGGMSSTPSVVDGVVYIGDWSSNAHAVDASSGGVLWSTDIGQTIMSSATVEDDAVYVAGMSSLVRLDRANGEIVWRQSTSDHPIAISPGAPTIAGDLVIQTVASGELMIPRDSYSFRGSMTAFDKATGDQAWQIIFTPGDETAGAGVGIWSTPTYDPTSGLVFIGTGNTYEPPAAPLSNSLVAVQAATGEIEWSTQFTYPDVWSVGHSGGLDADVGAAPNLFSAGGRDLVGVGDKRGDYYTLDRATGEQVWMTDLTEGSSLGGVIGTAAVIDDTIYVVSNVGNPDTNTTTDIALLVALDTATGGVRWSSEIESVVFAPVSASPGLVYVATISAHLLAFDADTGNELWRYEAADQSGAGMSVVDGTLYGGYGFSLFGRGSGLGGLLAFRLDDGGAAQTSEGGGEETMGARLYRTSCASCHGVRGTGITGPSLIGIADRMSEADHTAIVREGRNQMPAFGPTLTDEEIAAIVEHERSTFEGG